MAATGERREARELTRFGGGLRGEVGREALEHLGHLLLHEEADEVGGGVELQAEGRREAAAPRGHGGLKRLR